MNDRRVYAKSDAWFPAMFVGADPELRGKTGEAQHTAGDWWTFRYLRAECTVQVEAYRTEIEITGRR